MASLSVATPPQVVPLVGAARCGHHLHFYDTDAFLLRKVVDSVVPAPAAGGRAIAICTAEYLAQLEAMIDDEPRIDADMAARFTCVDADAALSGFMVDGMPDEQRFMHVVGGLLGDPAGYGRRPMRAFGEMVALMYTRGQFEAAERLKRLWEGLMARHEFGLLCAYPMSAFPDAGDSARFRAICDAHSHVDPIEQVAAAADDGDWLQRVLACLQQHANALRREQTLRRKAERLVAEQSERIAALQQVQAELRNQAGQDALTGLANRRIFDDRLAHALALARRRGSTVALLFIDIDNFKALNDRFGHATGDRLLREAARRLCRCARAADTVCRIGGDEFTVVMEDTDAGEASHLAQRLLDALAEEVAVVGERLKLTASLGLSLWPDDAAEAQALVEGADMAMYRAKRLGKGLCQRSSPRAGAGAGANSASLLSVEAAAHRLGVSRPHVLKLIAERRLRYVATRQGTPPLVPAREVDRLAKELERPAGQRVERRPA